MNRRLILVAASTATLGATVVLAQTEGLDLGAIKRNAAAAAADAQALVDQAKDRGKDMAEEARAVDTGGHANVERYAAAAKSAGSAVDLDDAVKQLGPAQAERGTAPTFIVFASLSMPKPSLRTLLADTSRAGGAVVFQGFPNNSVKAFQEGLGAVMDKERQYRGVGVDPRLFRAFHVEAVPTYVVVSSDFTPCDGFACETKVPPHDKLTGNVTVRYALETMAEGGGPGARVAGVALHNLDANGG